jgi:hypothetical protein
MPDLPHIDPSLDGFAEKAANPQIPLPIQRERQQSTQNIRIFLTLPSENSRYFSPRSNPKNPGLRQQPRPRQRSHRVHSRYSHTNSSIIDYRGYAAARDFALAFLRSLDRQVFKKEINDRST